MRLSFMGGSNENWHVLGCRPWRADRRGNFAGVARLQWEDDDATCEHVLTFRTLLDTVPEAEQHAVKQIELRVRDGVL
jgi:hypothetical protein